MDQFTGKWRELLDQVTKENKKTIKRKNAAQNDNWERSPIGQ